MSLHPFLEQHPLFKAYDIRGDRQLFTPLFTQALSEELARDFINLASAKQVVVGYDARHGSKQIAKQLADSFCDYGIEVVWLGLVSTPIMAFWANQYQGHGLIATASHSEPHINGIKWLLNSQSPSRDHIQTIYQNLATSSVKCSNSKPENKPAKLIELPQDLVAESYINKTISAMQEIDGFVSTADPFLASSTFSPLKIVIDCLNGATGPFAEALFNSHPALCSEVIALNSTPNGDFPNGNPDPMEENRLQQLCQSVIDNRADMGLSFDGDGDRLMVVDNKGQVLIPDHLLFLLARVAIEDHGHNRNSKLTDKPTVIFDVKCSHLLPSLIEQAGAVGQMSKTGSSILRRTLNNNKTQSNENIIFAGELSGHFIFNDGHFVLHDDAMYAGLRLLNWLCHQPFTISQIIHSLPEMVTTADVYLPLADYTTTVSSIQNKDKKEENLQPILKKLAALCYNLQSNLTELPMPLPADARLTCIDGLRLDFTHGFGIIRSSNTSNSLTVRFAGDSVSDLKSIQHYFVGLCQSISHELASQVANISVKQ